MEQGDRRMLVSQTRSEVAVIQFLAVAYGKEVLLPLDLALDVASTAGTIAIDASTGFCRFPLTFTKNCSRFPSRYMLGESTDIMAARLSSDCS